MLFGCWKEKWFDDKTNTTSCLIPKQDELHRDWLVMLLSLHKHTINCTISLHVLRLNCYWVSQVLSLDHLSDEYHMLSSHDSFYYALSSFLSQHVICPYVYSSLDPWFSHDPLSLCSRWFICSHNPLHSRTNQPIGCAPTFIFAKAVNVMKPLYQPTPTKIIWPFPHSLMPLFLYCCVIYRLHICGVLSWPHFCIYTALGRCGRLSLAL